MPPSQSVTDFAEFLSLPESPDADYNFFRDRWTPGTCAWILTHDTFTGWMGDFSPKPRVLWVHGNAASGKSILSSFVINHLVEAGLPCHYFFIRFISQEKRGISMLLRSLACQLATSTTPYAEKLQQLKAAGAELKTADYRTIWQWLFKQALFQLGQLEQPLYLVIDGIDEADRPASLIKLLADLHGTTLPIRILMVSRNTHEISSGFQKIAKQVDTETIRIEANPVDFRAYIDHEMDLGGDPSYREHVTTQLLDRARGNFLWVHLAVQRINSCHTKLDVDKALTELPSGMEALYDRMALSVQAASSASDRKLGQTILGWATCAQRLLTVEELGDALGNEAGVLEIHRTIAELCGGFVTVDHEGRVAMIHETAREYLTRGSEKGRPLVIDSRTTNDMLLKRCMACLTGSALRSQINRGQSPALLGYAATAWPHHLSLSSALGNFEILDVVANFLRTPYVLTWIYIAAQSGELRTLVAASRHLADIATKLRRRRNDDESVSTRQTIAVIEGWATDLVKILGKFGSNLRSQPDSIYKLIPPFCPEDSMIYRQFGRKESRALHVSGFTTSAWDDCLARFSLDPGAVASTIIASGGRIALLSVTRNTSQIIVYNSSTFEEQRRIAHPERVLSIQANKLGDLLVSYGYVTTRVWDVATGDCLKTIKNPRKRPRPQSIMFSDKQNAVVVCGEDRCIRTCSLDDDSLEWTIHSQIDEESLHDTIVNFPTCSALSPDGSMVAFGYRNHPLTVWELEPPMLLGQCYVRLDETDMTVEEKTWGEVFRVAWHPLNGEVFGLTQVGLLFRWDPHEEETSATVHSGGDSLAVNQDGSLVATGDGVGTVKIFASADFSRLYQLSSQDPVLYLAFSADSRRLYDTRGTYGNVWEPNSLVRLADCPDLSSDTSSETESLAKVSLLSEHHFARVDSVISLAGQSFGPLYCSGTEKGVATLYEAGRGKVCELARLASYMPIEHVVWSGDGRLVALADLSGKLAIKRVARSGENRDTWEASHEFDVVIPPEDGNIISQLIFHPTGSKLFVATPVKVFSVDLQSRTVAESLLDLTLKVKWACHPTRSDTLLGFGNTAVHVLSWDSLRQTEQHSYLPPRMGRSSTVSISSAAFARAGSFQRDTELLGRLITNMDSPEVLLEISSANPSGQFESQYLLFDIGNLRLGEAGQGEPRMLPAVVFAADISSRIREPLAILSRRRLVFLDVDGWICTWRLPSSTSGDPSALRRTKAPESGTDGLPGLEKYYFLPGDWIKGSDTRLCTVTPDGTLLCPRNGDVVTVQASRLRK
jgi:WD40 repeat protein